MRQDTAAAVCLSPLPLLLLLFLSPHLVDERKLPDCMAPLPLLPQELCAAAAEEEEERVQLVVLSRSSGAPASSSAALETTDGRWGARRCTDYLYPISIKVGAIRQSTCSCYSLQNKITITIFII